MIDTGGVGIFKERNMYAVFPVGAKSQDSATSHSKSPVFTKLLLCLHSVFKPTVTHFTSNERLTDYGELG